MHRRYTDRELSEARRDMTAAEAMLRRSLRDCGIGVKFRRQIPIWAVRR